MDIFLKEKYKIKELRVHAGTFHADDVFCAATLKLLNPELTVTRLFRAQEDETNFTEGIIMADIGGGIFDHHQSDAPYRSDGIRHCAFSRLWLTFGYSLVMKMYPNATEKQAIEVCQAIYDGLILSICLVDNGLMKDGGSAYHIGRIIECFVPEWNSDMDMDQAFMEAENLSEGILQREIRQQYAIVSARDMVTDAIEKMNNGIIILKEGIPWEDEVTKCLDAKIVIYPSRRKEYNLQLVPVETGSFTTRIDVPDNWKGKRDMEADACCAGMTFCHNSGFLCCFEEEEQAIKAASLIIKLWNQRES